MPDPLPRWLLALAGIVALVAICVGIKDYVQRKDADSQASALTSAVVNPAPVARHKKTTSAKTKQTRGPANELSSRSDTSLAANGTEKPLVSAEFATLSGNEASLLGSGPEAASDQAEAAAMDEDYRVRNHSAVFPGSSACLPLPNLTQPGDVDAPYYENWAKEYCGQSQ